MLDLIHLDLSEVILIIEQFWLGLGLMTVESNCAIAISTLGDWPKNLTLVFQPMRSKTKSNRTRALSKLQVIAGDSDWYIALFSPVVIDRRNDFGVGFSTII